MPFPQRRWARLAAPLGASRSAAGRVSQSLFFFVLVSLVALAANTPARAYWEISYTGFTYSHTFDGANQGPPAYNPGYTISAGGGWPGGASSAEASENFTIQGTWIPAGGAPAPPNAVIEVTSSAQASVTDNGTTTGAEVSSEALSLGIEGWADDGLGDEPNAQGVSSGTHYIVVPVTSGSFSQPLSLSAGMPSSDGDVSAAVGPVTVSALTGYWDGPYYFNNGNYTVTSPAPGGNGSQMSTTPWPNGTGITTPNSSNIVGGMAGFMASNNSFSYNAASATSLGNSGSITPYWLWNGQALLNNQLPPGFEMYIAATATASTPDYDEIETDEAFDGIALGTQTVPGTETAQDFEYYPAQVFAYEDSAEADGYMALGPTLQPYADVGVDDDDGAPLSSSVGVTASISNSQ